MKTLITGRSATWILLLFILSVDDLPGQEAGREALYVADYILAETNRQIIDAGSGEPVSPGAGFPVSMTYRVGSPYLEWKYWNGVLALGMIRLGQVTGHDRYVRFASENYRWIFENVGHFKKHFDAGMKKPPFYLFYRMSRLDDCGAMAAGLCEVYGLEPDPAYLDYLQEVAGFIEDEEVRLEDGTIVRPKPREYTLWADDLYMSVPFLSGYAMLTGQEKYMDDALNLVENFRRYLFRPVNGLYYHCWYSDIGRNGVAHWARCNGWVMMAHVELLKRLPADHPRRDWLIRVLRDHILGVSQFQDPSGLWHQLLDKPDSYLESSATAMFVYSIALAVNEGWIGPSYAGIALDGWSGLMTKITAGGQVRDICVGTGIEDRMRYYYERPVKLNDIHGLGAVLLAGAELIRLESTLYQNTK